MNLTRPPSRHRSEASEHAAPPRIESPPSGIPWVMLTVTALVLVGLLVLFFFDPARHAFYPFCLFKKVTGYDCPGCGGLRALHQLLQGNLGRAFQLNAMVVMALPALLLWLAWRWRNRERSQPLSGRMLLVLAWALAMGLVLFGILRNLPLWPFGVTPG